MIRNTAYVALGLAVAVAACESDSTGPTLDRAEVAGTYELTTLSFDPQGSLAEVSLAGQFAGVLEPRLILSATGDAQLLYTDPVTDLARTVDGSYTTTSTGVRISFDSGDTYAELLLPRTIRLDFDATAGTLTFDGAAQGVARARLIALAPELATEQLLDPVPGDLRVVFTAEAAGS